jgi:hypothetical protein
MGGDPPSPRSSRIRHPNMVFWMCLTWLGYRTVQHIAGSPGENGRRMYLATTTVFLRTSPDRYLRTRVRAVLRMSQ